MGLAATRRAFGALTAIAIGLLPALAQPITAGAAGTGTLFGLVSGPTAGVANINPTTGAVTSVATFGSNWAGTNSLAVDPATHRLFLPRTTQDLSVLPITSTYQLVTVDTRTPATITVSPNLSRSVGNLVFDSTSSTLYGVTGDKWVVRIDPATGVMTNLATFSADDVTSMVLAPATHTLFLASLVTTPRTSQLLMLDIATNSLTPGPVLTPAIRALVYDTSQGRLFGLTFCCPARLMHIGPTSGVGSEIGNNPLGLGAGLAIDSASHTVFVTQDVMGAPAYQVIVSISLGTGVKASSGAIPNTTYVSALVFEPAATPLTDTSPPTTSIALSPAPNAAGWNRTNVTVNLSATDPDGVADVATVHYSATGAQTIAPTMVTGSAASFTLTAEGVTTITYFAKDRAGNTQVAHTQVVRIDKTLPTVTYTGNAGIYTVDQTISITCTAVDPLNANGTTGSGLASTTCANVNAPAYSFPLGPNTLSASATDVAGNVGTGSTTFTVGGTLPALCTLTVQFIETSPKFLSLHPRAQAHLVRLVTELCILQDDQVPPDPENKADLIANYQKALTHLVGRGFLTPAHAAILLSLSRAL